MRACPLLALLLFCSVGAAAASQAAPVAVATGQTHRGWTDAIILRNATVEAVIVPSVGRVMQLRFVGEAEGPFWENPKIAGQTIPANPWREAHGSFGGDKTWPAPQSLWNWPPPAAFDAAPNTAAVAPDGSVTLTSPVDTRFGLRALRRITLDPAEPVLRITTTYEKVTGEPVRVSVWVICQLHDPVAVFLPIPAGTHFPSGINPEWPVPAPFLQRDGDGLRFIRDPAKSRKTGNDGTALVWAGTRHLLRMTIPRVAGADYPDNGCSVEVYGNQDPFPYVELETLSPLQTLRAGEAMSATTTYRLARRTTAPLEADVRNLLNPLSP